MCISYKNMSTNFVDQYITGFVLEFLLLFGGVELLPAVSVQPSYVHVLDTLLAVRNDRSPRLAAAPRPGEQTLNLKQPETDSNKFTTIAVADRRLARQGRGWEGSHVSGAPPPH